MFAIFLLLFISRAVQGQVNIAVHPKLASYTSVSSIQAVELSEDQDQAYLLLCQSPVFKVVHLNISTPGGPTQIGEYLTSTPINCTLIAWMYNFNGYLIVSIASYAPLVFNLTTYQLVGQFNSILDVRSFKYVKSKNIVLYTDRKSRVFRSDVSTFPNPIVTQMSNLNVLNSAFVQISYDEIYFSVTYSNVNSFSIWNLTDYTMLHNISTVCNFNMHFWSPDSQYIAILPRCSNGTLLQVYDRNAAWALSTKTFGHININFGFNYFETNTLVFVSSTNNMIATMNWYDFSVSNLTFTLTGKYGRVSSTNKAFGVYNLNSFTVWYFVISQFCSNSTYFNTVVKSCDSCPNNCLNCANGLVCHVCVSSYQMINGTCQPCSAQTYYNSTTLLCESCPLNCFVCPSSLVCSTCASNYINVNGSCQTCPNGTFFNSLSLACDSCPNNCFVCPSTSTCTSCMQNYQIANGTCVATTNPVSNISSSVNCPTDCLQCTSPTICTQCDQGSSLLRGNCIYVQNQVLKGTLEFTLENQVLKFTNKIPASRILMSQFFSFFVNIDHLWLYIYHKSSYSYTMDSFLKSVNRFQQQKWNTLNKEQIYSKFQVSTDYLEKQLNIKLNQTSAKYIEIEQQSRSFFNNTLNYFLLNIPLVILIFFLFKILFYLTFSYRISSLFREYSFNFFLAYMLLEGNFQSFTYLIMFDCSELINENNIAKVVNILTVVLGFFFFLMVFGGHLFIYMAYNNNSKYFLKGLKNNFKSIFFKTIDSGFLNFFLGCCHIFLENDEPSQLAVLAFIEGAYFWALVSSLKSNSVHEKKSVGWQFLVATGLRLVLITTYMIKKADEEEMIIFMNQAHSILIFMYLMNWIFSVIIEHCFLVSHFVSYLIAYFWRDTKQVRFIEKNEEESKGKYNLKKIKDIFETQREIKLRRKNNNRYACFYQKGKQDQIKTAKDAGRTMTMNFETASIEDYFENYLDQDQDENDDQEDNDTDREENSECKLKTFYKGIKVKSYKKLDRVSANKEKKKYTIVDRESMNVEKTTKGIILLVNSSSKKSMFRTKKRIEDKKMTVFKED